MDVTRTDCMVSVVCITYNHENYIRDALESFVNQKVNFPYEILVGDDASPDGTADIIREYEAKYPSLVRGIYQTENLYSKGEDQMDILFDAARGKYIAFCEGDDYWLDDTRLQTQVDYLEANPDCSACVGNTIWHYCDNSQPDQPFVRCSCECDFEFSELVNGNLIHLSTLLAKAELLKYPPEYYKVGLKYGVGDFPILIHCLLMGKVHFFNRFFSYYRYRSNPTAFNCQTASGWYTLCMIDVLRSVIPYTDRERTEQVKQAILQHEFQLLYLEGKDREQHKEPYRTILRQQSLSYRIKNLVKCVFPWTRTLHRKWLGLE